MAATDSDFKGNYSTQTSSFIDVYSALLNQTLEALEKSTPLTPSESENQGFVSSDLLYVFTLVNYVVLSVTVSICGVITNVINILVFLRMGFRETINISLFGMAVSDVILQIMTLWVAVCLNPWFDAGHASSGEAFFYMGSWVQVTCTRITGWITAFVTFERCLCIVLPLRVKRVLPPRRVKFVIGCIFVGATVCVLPVYLTFRIDTVCQSRSNATLLTFVLVESMGPVQDAVFYLNNVASPLGSFTVVAVCTTQLAVNIKRTTRRRLKLSASTAEATTKTRGRKLIKMVASIAAIYIVCYTPTISVFVWMVEDTEFSFYGRYRNLFLLLTSFAVLLESVNSSLNIAIYYHMSSKYRDAFKAYFCTKGSNAGRPVDRE